MKHTQTILIAVLAALIAGLPCYVFAEIIPSWMFGDHMVLQRDMPIPVWGTAETGERVTVELDGRRESATTDNRGRWRVTLGPLATGGPYTMTVSGDNTVTFTDILAGEVWLCSGQSNMWWSVGHERDIPPEQAPRDVGDIRLISLYSPESEKFGSEPIWKQCTVDNLQDFSAVGWFFGRRLNEELGVPVGLIHSSMGGSLPEAWMRIDTLKADPLFRPIIAYLDSLAVAHPDAAGKFAAWMEGTRRYRQENGDPPENDIFSFLPKATRYYMRKPEGVYRAQLEPIIPFAIRGVIWYQGESSVDRAWQYRELFPALIREWRGLWGQGDFPFIYVQLQNYGTNGTDPVNSLPELREAQLMSLRVPNTAMAVTIDIGEKDVHANNKWDMGTRLCLGALKVVYGRDIVASGPIYRGMKVENGMVRLTFDHTNGGLATPGNVDLTGFAVAGEDRVFHPAEARIEGNEVVVRNRDIAAPRAVRYGWDNNPSCNLYNDAGLPASPFRTDSWPGVTYGRVTPVN